MKEQLAEGGAPQVWQDSWAADKPVKAPGEGHQTTIKVKANAIKQLASKTPVPPLKPGLLTDGPPTAITNAALAPKTPKATPKLQLNSGAPSSLPPQSADKPLVTSYTVAIMMPGKGGKKPVVLRPPAQSDTKRMAAGSLTGTPVGAGVGSSTGVPTVEEQARLNKTALMTALANAALRPPPPRGLGATTVVGIGGTRRPATLQGLRGPSLQMPALRTPATLTLVPASASTTPLPVEAPSPQLHVDQNRPGSALVNATSQPLVRPLVVTAPLPGPSGPLAHDPPVSPDLIEQLRLQMTQVEGTSGRPCSFSRTCKRLNCPDMHQQGRDIEDDPSILVCRFGRRCKRTSCFYLHPAGRELDEDPSQGTCKLGKDCTKPGCVFSHPDGRALTCQLVCHTCGERGHIQRECPQKELRLCRLCGEPGHIQRDCPLGRRGGGKRLPSGTYVTMSGFPEKWAADGRDKLGNRIAAELEVFGVLVAPPELMDDGRRAIAAFADAELARKAVQELNGTVFEIEFCSAPMVHEAVDPTEGRGAVLVGGFPSRWNHTDVNTLLRSAVGPKTIVASIDLLPRDKDADDEATNTARVQLHSSTDARRVAADLQGQKLAGRPLKITLEIDGVVEEEHADAEPRGARSRSRDRTLRRRDRSPLIMTRSAAERRERSFSREGRRTEPRVQQRSRSGRGRRRQHQDVERRRASPRREAPPPFPMPPPAVHSGTPWGPIGGPGSPEVPPPGYWLPAPWRPPAEPGRAWGPPVQQWGQPPPTLPGGTPPWMPQTIPGPPALTAIALGRDPGPPGAAESASVEPPLSATTAANSQLELVDRQPPGDTANDAGEAKAVLQEAQVAVTGVDFWASLPSQLTRQEDELSNAVVVFLNTWRESHEDGKCPNLIHLGADPTVRSFKAKALPAEVALKTWIERRLAHRVELVKDSAGKRILRALEWPT